MSLTAFSSSLLEIFAIQTLSQVTPLNLTAEDGEYAFYRNIMDETEFPFDRLLDSSQSQVAAIIQKHFLAEDGNRESNGASDILRIDDAFCINYNMSQDDTRCAKHTDPSDITLNMCLECLDEIEGSQVLFYGTQELYNVARGSEGKVGDESFLFLVRPVPGYATVHWGHHPHQTVPLKRGERTNIVVTFCYKDKSKSTALLRTCYATDGS